MTVDQNKLSALLRQQNDRISELESALRATQKNQPYVSFKEKTLRDALKSTPNYYVWEITFAQWAAQALRRATGTPSPARTPTRSARP